MNGEEGPIRSWTPELRRGQRVRVTSELAVSGASIQRRTPALRPSLPFRLAELPLRALDCETGRSKGGAGLVCPLLGLGQLATGLVRLPFCRAEGLLGGGRARPGLAKLLPCLFDALCGSALAARSSRLLGSSLFPRRSPPTWRRSLGEGCEQVEARGLEVGRQPATREQLPALGRHGCCLERLHDPVERGVALSAGLVEDPGCRSAKVAQRFAFRPPRLIEAARFLSREETLLGLAKAVACVEEKVDLSALLPGELIDRRRRDGRLPQSLDLFGLLPEPGVAQLAGEPVALGDERTRLERVEAIELALDVYPNLLPGRCRMSPKYRFGTRD